METVVGIFSTRSLADSAIERLRAAGIPNERINLLAPGTSANDRRVVPTSQTEQPGMGKAIGGVVGGAIGAATGVSLGAAAATIIVPGVGPVIALGILGAALLGAGGAKVGETLEEGMAEGLPVDELFVYEDALRQGRSVLIIQVEDNEHADGTRKIMQQAGAEGVDSARENWWVGLRDAEEENYAAHGKDFKSIETEYRSGFEAALRPQTRDKSYDEAAGYLKTCYAGTCDSNSFRRGYDRGQAYYRSLREKHREPVS